MSESSVQKITVSQRSRPLRFGFLLRGWHDSDGLRVGIRLFTSLWGGKYNCFVPVDRDPPGWWKGPESGIEIARGYLGAFEPDFLVTDDPSLVDGLGYDRNRVLLMSDLLGQDPSTPFSHGLGVHELFQWMWRNDFQYKKRNPPKIMLPRAAEKAQEAFVATCFGEFPDKDGKGPDFEKIFSSVFDAADVTLTPEELLRLRVKRVGFPLSMGAARLELRGRGWRFDSLLYLLDPGSTLDLVDFWNLRALGMNPIPVPAPWFDALRPQLAKAVKKAHRPHPLNTNLMLHTTLMHGRSLEEEEVRAHEQRLLADCPDGWLRHRYPRIWSPFGRAQDRALRSEVTASSEATEIVLKGDRIAFRACSLPVEASFSPYRKFDSARVILVRDDLGASGLASVTPRDLKSARQVLGSLPMHSVWFSSEGIVATSKGQDRFLWKLPRGIEVCRTWLAQHGLKFEVTSGGKLMYEAMRRLGGLDNTWMLAREELAKLLKRMAGLPERPGRTYSRSDLLVELEKATKHPVRAYNLLHGLVGHEILDIGVRLQCERCAQHNWYPLDAVRKSLRCHRCLQDFPFPTADPPEDPWSYRTVGPFAVENYIHGGLSVLLSLRLLARTGEWFPSQGITWCPSFTLKRDDENWGEVDALAFLAQEAPYTGSVLPAFVEGKSYGNFSDADRNRMRRIGNYFPGAVLIFATLKSKLSLADNNLIKPLAEAGREPIHDGHWRNPVVVLTGRELFSEMGPPTCWEGLDETGEFAKMHRAESSLQSLADATQQLYLGMEPYSKYFGRWVKNRAQS